MQPLEELLTVLHLVSRLLAESASDPRDLLLRSLIAQLR
jgi:hypothetical protein